MPISSWYPRPHGREGEIREGFLSAEELALLAEGRAPRIRLSPRALADATALAHGAYTPLRGFLGREAWGTVAHEMRLPDGTLWPIPIGLAPLEEEVKALGGAEEALLLDPSGAPVGQLVLEEVYRVDPLVEAERVYGTTDPSHPGVVRTLEEGPFRVAGGVRLVLRDSGILTPLEVRSEAGRRGWRRMAGFQTRNPLHRAHEYLTKVALEVTDGLLLHPLVGETKEDDVPAEVRLECYRVLLDFYYPRRRVILSGFPAPMRYAGPREAILHAICRKNYGCTHFVVGRDHAGVGSYYGPFDAHRLLETHEEEIGIELLYFDNAFWCRRCQSMATEKTCPHGREERVSLSGTRVRALLSRGEAPPPEVTRPEVAEVLLRAVAGWDGGRRDG